MLSIYILFIWLISLFLYFDNVEFNNSIRYDLIRFVCIPTFILEILIDFNTAFVKEGNIIKCRK